MQTDASNLWPPWEHRALSESAFVTPNRPDSPRPAEVHDASEFIPEVSLDWLQSNVLPPLPLALTQDNLDSVIEELTRLGTLEKSGSWANFGVEPQCQHGRGFQMAKLLVDIVSDIGKAAKAILPRLDQRVEFKCNSETASLFTHRRDASRPDIVGIYKGHRSHSASAKRLAWEVLVAPGEFKKSGDLHARNDNVNKMLGSFRHIMGEDVRRRFVVGYTVENACMRLWFCSRTDLLVSEYFDFMTNPRALAYFVLSQMYASESQLGYDTTIRYPADVSLHGKQWDIDVRVWVPHPEVSSDKNKRKGRGRTGNRKGKRSGNDDGLKGSWVTQIYRTSKILSNLGAEIARGKGTRVWEALRLVQIKDQDRKVIRWVTEGKPVVLKDSWVDSSRDRETVVIQQILDSAPEEEKATLKKHFLTVICHGDVCVGSASMESDTTSRMRGGRIVQTERYFRLHAKTAASCTWTSLPPHRDQNTASCFQSEESKIAVLAVEDKSHRRIVFGDVGANIDTLNSVNNIIDVLCQTTVALRSIHKCGWVHGDISSGNVLVVDGIAKLTDFEYSQKMSDKIPLTAPIGTLYFIACEVNEMKYLSRSDDGEDEDDDDLKAELPAFERAIAVPKTVVPPELPFYYNPLHDIESLWWLAVRLLLWRLTAAQYQPDQGLYWNLEKSIKQANYYGAFFYDHWTRYTVHMIPEFRAGGDIVHPRLSQIVGHLEVVRSKIKRAYAKAEKNIEDIDHTTGTKALDTLLTHLTFLKSQYEKTDFQLEPIKRPLAKSTPEEHAALPLPTSLACRLQNWLQVKAEPGYTHDTIHRDHEDFDGDVRERIREAKCVKLDNTDARSPVAGPSTVELTGVEAEPVATGHVQGVVLQRRKVNSKTKSARKVHTSSRRKVALLETLRRSARIRAREASRAR